MDRLDRDLAVATRGLSKHYPIPRQKDKRIAVEGLDLDVAAGTIFGFLGPNGAGKTTTIKMLLGFTAPTAGDAWLYSKSITDDRARLAVGYVPEQPYFHKFLTVSEIVRGHGVLSGLSQSDAKRRAGEALEIVEMAQYASLPLAKLSKGMTQRIALATALVGDPDLLVLDEPSSGLDPLGRKFLRDLLQSLRERGKTVFLSSHLLSEMESVCDHVGILARGRLVACGRPADIVEARDEVAVEVDMLERDAVLTGAIEGCGARLESPATAGGPDRLVVPSSQVYGVLEILKARQVRLVSIAPRRETLEDAFVRLVH